MRSQKREKLSWFKLFLCLNLLVAVFYACTKRDTLEDKSKAITADDREEIPEGIAGFVFDSVKIDSTELLGHWMLVIDVSPEPDKIDDFLADSFEFYVCTAKELEDSECEGNEVPQLIQGLMVEYPSAPVGSDIVFIRACDSSIMESGKESRDEYCSETWSEYPYEQLSPNDGALSSDLDRLVKIYKDQQALDATITLLSLYIKSETGINPTDAEVSSDDLLGAINTQLEVEAVLGDDAVIIEDVGDVVTAEEVADETLTDTEDSDGDGVVDTSDDYPNDPEESTDTDGDGLGDNLDTDDDNDGTPDEDDALPTNSTEDTDTDGDGIGNEADADDNDDGIADTGSTDTNGDGVEDDVTTVEPDDIDGDGVLKSGDTDDADPLVCADSDGDGCDDCSQGTPGNYGADTTKDGADLDEDGICDGSDPDIDGDGVLNGSDDCDDTAKGATIDTKGCEEEEEATAPVVTDEGEVLDSGGAISGGAIAGIAVGGVGLTALVGGLAYAKHRKGLPKTVEGISFSKELVDAQVGEFKLKAAQQSKASRTLQAFALKMQLKNAQADLLAKQNLLPDATIQSIAAREEEVVKDLERAEADNKATIKFYEGKGNKLNVELISVQGDLKNAEADLESLEKYSVDVKTASMDTSTEIERQEAEIAKLQEKLKTQTGMDAKITNDAIEFRQEKLADYQKNLGVYDRALRSEELFPGGRISAERLDELMTDIELGKGLWAGGAHVIFTNDPKGATELKRFIDQQKAFIATRRAGDSDFLAKLEAQKTKVTNLQAARSSVELKFQKLNEDLRAQALDYEGTIADLKKQRAGFYQAELAKIDKELAGSPEIMEKINERASITSEIEKLKVDNTHAQGLVDQNTKKLANIEAELKDLETKMFLDKMGPDGLIKGTPAERLAELDRLLKTQVPVETVKSLDNERIAIREFQGKQQQKLQLEEYVTSLKAHMGSNASAMDKLDANKTKVQNELFALKANAGLSETKLTSLLAQRDALKGVLDARAKVTGIEVRQAKLAVNRMLDDTKVKMLKGRGYADKLQKLKDIAQKTFTGVASWRADNLGSKTLREKYDSAYFKMKQGEAQVEFFDKQLATLEKAEAEIRSGNLPEAEKKSALEELDKKKAEWIQFKKESDVLRTDGEMKMYTFKNELKADKEVKFKGAKVDRFRARQAALNAKWEYDAKVVELNNKLKLRNEFFPPKSSRSLGNDKTFDFYMTKMGIEAGDTPDVRGAKAEAYLTKLKEAFPQMELGDIETNMKSMALKAKRVSGSAFEEAAVVAEYRLLANRLRDGLSTKVKVDLEATQEARRVMLPALQKKITALESAEIAYRKVKTFLWGESFDSKKLIGDDWLMSKFDNPDIDMAKLKTKYGVGAYDAKLNPKYDTGKWFDARNAEMDGIFGKKLDGLFDMNVKASGLDGINAAKIFSLVSEKSSKAKASSNMADALPMFNRVLEDQMLKLIQEKAEVSRRQAESYQADSISSKAE